MIRHSIGPGGTAAASSWPRPRHRRRSAAPFPHFCGRRRRSRPARRRRRARREPQTRRDARVRGLKPGRKIAELLPGGGYFTRIISKAVGSARPRLCARARRRVPMRPPNAPDFAARVKAIAADPNYSNVSVVVEPFAELKTPGAGRSGVDLAELSRSAQFPGPGSHGVQSNGIRGAQAGRHLPHPGSCRRCRGPGSRSPRHYTGSTRKWSNRKCSPQASNSSAAAICCTGRAIRIRRRCSIPRSAAAPINSS